MQLSVITPNQILILLLCFYPLAWVYFHIGHSEAVHPSDVINTVIFSPSEEKSKTHHWHEMYSNIFCCLTNNPKLFSIRKPGNIQIWEAGSGEMWYFWCNYWFRTVNQLLMDWLLQRWVRVKPHTVRSPQFCEWSFSFHWWSRCHLVFMLYFLYMW